MSKETLLLDVQIEGAEDREYRWGDLIRGVVTAAATEEQPVQELAVGLRRVSSSSGQYGSTVDGIRSEEMLASDLTVTPGTPLQFPFELRIPVAEGLSGIREWQDNSNITRESWWVRAAAQAARGVVTADREFLLSPPAAIQAVADALRQAAAVTLEFETSSPRSPSHRRVTLEDKVREDLLSVFKADDEEQRRARVKVHFDFRPTPETKHVFDAVKLVAQETDGRVTGTVEINPKEHSFMDHLKAMVWKDLVRHSFTFPAAELATAPAGSPPKAVVAEVRGWFEPYLRS